MWCSAFWSVKVYIHCESSFNTLYIEIKTQMLKKVPSYKICKTLQKIHSFFSFSSSNSSQFFNSRFLNELQHKFHLSESVWDFKLRFCLVFVKKLIFLFNKKHWFFDFKTSQHSFGARLLIFKSQQEVWKFINICVSWSSSKTNLETNLEKWSFE